MLTLSDFHDYQLRAVNHQISNPRSFLWLFMGAGKTPITLTTIAHLQRHGAIRAALVVAPLRVVQSVWEREARKWEHTRHLRFSLIHGTPQERLRAVTRPADVYLINYEGLVWLSAQLQHYYIKRGTLLPFDMLILDESSKMKQHATKRMEAIVPLLPYFSYRTGLTGTPSSNGLVDLFGQFLVIDNGERLGSSYSSFLSNWFDSDGYGGYRYQATADGERAIHRRVADIVLEMSQQEYLQLPDFIVNDLYVDLEPRHRAQYDRLERELFTELDSGVELEVLNEAAKTNKCLQYSNGAAYTNTETREWAPVHDAKLDALEDIVEEAAGEPVLVAYTYRPDAYRIMKRFPYARNITGMSASEFNQALEDWQAGRLRMLIAHPASAGHGIDGLQARGRVLVWFGLNWSLELYLQFNARLHRQGQSAPVVCHRILTRDTLDDAVRLSLEYKTQTQEDLRRAVSEYRRRKERTATVVDFMEIAA